MKLFLAYCFYIQLDQTYLLLRKWIIQGQNANTVIQVVEAEQIDLTHSDSTKHLSI